MHQQDTKVCIAGKELEDFLKLNVKRTHFFAYLAIVSRTAGGCPMILKYSEWTYSDETHRIHGAGIFAHGFSSYVSLMFGA